MSGRIETSNPPAGRDENIWKERFGVVGKSSGGAIYAVFGDIHGNLEALDAILADASKLGVNHYACVGDIVGYNANPVECLEKIRRLNCVCVKGNHDHYCSLDSELEGFHPYAADAVDWTRAQLSDEQQQFLADMKYVNRAGIFTIVHSTLDMPASWGYVFEELEAEASFNYQKTTVCFHGHTHVPLVFQKAGEVSGGTYNKLSIVMGKKYFVNVGSVGQPRDGDPRAAYCVFDVKKRQIELRRIPYDVAQAQKKVRKAGLPEKLAARLGTGR